MCVLPDETTALLKYAPATSPETLRTKAQAEFPAAGWSIRSSDRLVVCIEAPVAAEPLTQAQVTHVLCTHFRRVAEEHTQRIADIFRHARAATLIGLLVLVCLMSAAQAIPDDAGRWMVGVRESVVIFAWVAMWKPAELWLYDHWPLRHWRRAALRLADAQVRLVGPG